MEEYVGDMKKYYDCFGRRFDTIVREMLLKINSFSATSGAVRANY